MFETDRLFIRLVEKSDAKALKHGTNQLHYIRYMSNGPLIPVSEDRADELTNSRANHELPRFAICHKPENYDPNLYIPGDEVKQPPMIGVIAFQNQSFDFKNRGCTLGIGFWDPKDRGKGYGTEVLTWAFNYGFDELGLHRIALNVYTMNESAIKLYRKIGLIEEGRLRQTCYSAGEWYDTLVFGLLRDDWEELNRKKLTST